MTTRRLGPIVRIQVQRERLKRHGEGYFPDPLLAGDEVSLGPDGLMLHHDGGWVIDTHHRAHPHYGGSGTRALSMGFTGHYSRMVDRFGRAPLGIAGENLIVETDDRIEIGDLGGTVLIRGEAGEIALTGARVAAPCKEFCTFMLGREGVADREEIADHLDFLGDGMRGYILDVSRLAGPVRVRVGDEVLVRA
jgi:hypothetical protein